MQESALDPKVLAVRAAVGFAHTAVLTIDSPQQAALYPAAIMLWYLETVPQELSAAVETP